MAKQYILRRQIGSIAIVGGGFATIDLPRDYDYQAIGLRLAATVTVGVGGATSVRAEAPLQLVPRLEVIADGKNTIWSTPMWYTSLANVERPLAEYNARAITPPTGAAAADYAVEAIGIIDHQFFNGVRPKDTNFRSRNLSLFQLRATFGNPGDIFVPGAGAVTFKAGVNPVLEVFALQEVEETDQNGNFVSSPAALKKVSYQEAAQAASSANAQVLLPAGNCIQKVLVRCEGLTTAGEPDTGVLNNITLANGVDVRYNLSGKQTRALNNADFGAVQAGYYIADLTACGSGGNWKLTDLWDVTKAAQPKVIMDVTGGASVKTQIVTTEMILAQ